MDLTEDWLRRHATAASFERGEGYYDDARIERLVKEGDVYRAEVLGSQSYRQVVDLSGTAPELTCTCPYQSGGYCKHLVAVGLAILHGDYQEGITQGVEPSAPAPLDPAQLDRWWQQSTSGQKMSFLAQLLRKRPDLQHQWGRFLAAPAHPTLRVDLTRVRREVYEALAAIDLVNLDNPDLDPEERIDQPTWENAEQALLHQLYRAFTAVRQELSRWQQAEDWPNALLVLLGWYEGLQAAIHPEPEAWAAHADPAWELYYRHFHRLIDALGQALLPFATSKWALGYLLERWDRHEQALNPAQPERSVRYALDDWTLLVQVLVQDPVSARFLDTRLQAYGLSGVVPAAWARHLHRMQGGAEG